MNEKTTPQDGGSASVPISENEHVKELFTILTENGKDTSGLAALINHVSGMEDFVQKAEEKIVTMKSQFDAMKEIQDHPIKAALQKSIRTLESKVAEVKAQIAELKSCIIDGCKNAVAAFKDKGIGTLDKLASFFHIKGGLQAIKNDTAKSVDICDKAIAQIETFSTQYHTAGRALKNMARMLIGKEPIDAVKESGKLAKAFTAPYRAEKTIMLSIQKQVGKMITALDNLAQNAETKRGERAEKPKKPTLKERLDAKKREIKERETSTPERKPKSQEIGA